VFAVDDIDDVVARMRAHGAELVGEVGQYEDLYRLCYVRGPDGIIVALAEQLRLNRAPLHRRYRLAAQYARRLNSQRGAEDARTTARKLAIGSGAIAAARTMGAHCFRSGTWRRSGRP